MNINYDTLADIGIWAVRRDSGDYVSDISRSDFLRIGDIIAGKKFSASLKEMFEATKEAGVIVFASELLKNSILESLSPEQIRTELSNATGINLNEQIKSGQSKANYAAKLAYKAITGEELTRDIIDNALSKYPKIVSNGFFQDYLSLPDNLKELYYATTLPELPTQEFTPLDQTDVSKLYVGIFGRASEGSGNKGWITFSSANKADMAKVADTMLETDAARTYFGNTLNDNFEMIKFFYENVFNKTYSDASKGMELDKDGIDAWVNELNNGKSKGHVISEILKTASLPELAHLDAAKLFNNKVVLSNKIADSVESADVNNLTPFVNILKSVQPDTNASDISQLISNMGLVETNITQTGSWSIDGDTLNISESFAGVIEVDKFPKHIVIGGKDITEDININTNEEIVKTINYYIPKIIKLERDSISELEGMASFLDQLSDEESREYEKKFTIDGYYKVLDIFKENNTANFNSSKINKLAFAGSATDDFGKFALYIERDGYVSDGGYGYSETGDILIERKHMAVFETEQDQDWFIETLEAVYKTNNVKEQYNMILDAFNFGA